MHNYQFQFLGHADTLPWRKHLNVIIRECGWIQSATETYTEMHYSQLGHRLFSLLWISIIIRCRLNVGDKVAKVISAAVLSSNRGSANASSSDQYHIVFMAPHGPDKPPPGPPERLL